MADGKRAFDLATEKAARASLIRFREGPHKAYSVILSAVKNPGILHVADSVQNDKLACAEFS